MAVEVPSLSPWLLPSCPLNPAKKLNWGKRKSRLSRASPFTPIITRKLFTRVFFHLHIFCSVSSICLKSVVTVYWRLDLIGFAQLYCKQNYTAVIYKGNLKFIHIVWKNSLMLFDRIDTKITDASGENSKFSSPISHEE